MLNRSYCKKRSSRCKRNRISNILGGIAAFLLVLILPLEFICRPILDHAVAVQGQRIAAQVLSEETLSLLEEIPLAYGDVVRLERNEQGQISAIETDTSKVNLLKNRLEQSVTARLSLLADKELHIPLGTLLDSPILMGRGPGVPIRVAPLGVLRSELVSRFQTAGINQTSHQVFLKLTLETTTLIPLHKANTVSESKFLIAETIIVGEVPEYYTNILSDGQRLYSDIKDSLPEQDRVND